MDESLYINAEPKPANNDRKRVMIVTQPAIQSHGEFSPGYCPAYGTLGGERVRLVPMPAHVYELIRDTAGTLKTDKDEFMRDLFERMASLLGTMMDAHAQMEAADVQVMIANQAAEVAHAEVRARMHALVGEGSPSMEGI